MHSTIKKLGAILLALTLLFALSATAFAAGEEELGQDKSVVDGSTVISDAGAKQDYTDSDYTDSIPGTYAALGNTVRIDKEIIIFNTRSTDTIVYLPNVKFNYTIAAATVTAGTPTITDERDNSAKVKSGVAAALSTTSADVSFSNVNGIKTGYTTISSATYVTTKTTGVAAAGYFDVTFTPANFGSAGIYRYIITEAEDTTLTRAKAGVTNTSYTATRYLDVYVRNNAAGTGLEIYGYVLFEDTTNTVNTSFDADDKKLTAKTNGFVSNKNDDGTTAYSTSETDVDIYETSNVKIQKITTGALGDKNNEFPFEATIANATIVSDPKISYQVINDTATLDTSAVNSTATMTGGTATIGAAAASVVNGFKLDNEDYIYIYGIPGANVASTVTTGEYNNTVDVYKVTATYDGSDVNLNDHDDETNNAEVKLESTQHANMVSAEAIDISLEQDVIVVTNTLDEVSPTGVVLRVAPYALMLGAGFIFLVISKRRKEEATEA